jgi:hypothetical protein
MLLRKEQTSLRSSPPDLEPELATLIASLERNGERSLAELTQAIDKVWPAPKQPKKTKPAAPAAADPSQWVSKLRQARANTPAFEALLREIEKSKQLKAPDVAAIANRFRSTTKKYKSRAAAVVEIRKAWLEDQRDAVKVEKADGIF